MDLSEKIKQILVKKNITPSLFADEIGIQRSSISHILAGRNKPSLDIVQKIVKRFPDLGLNWILDEEELPEIAANAETSLSATNAPKPAVKTRSIAQPELPRRNQPQIAPVQQNVSQPFQTPNSEKTVDRVLIFYSDGTFQEFK